MDKNPVTRTISLGPVCSGKKTSEDISLSRRHSSAGIRAFLWATSSAKSLRCSLGSDFQTSWENICPNILTPDSIPQFTIPSLSVQSSLRSLDKETEGGDAETDEGLGSSRSELESSLSASLTCCTLSSTSSCSSFISVGSDRRAERSISDPFSHRRSLLQRELSSSDTEAQQCLDPASRAALSLPHLAKVTTPYGFITLSQSPQMASEEALLYQAGLWRLNKTPVTRTVDNSSYLSEDKKRRSKDLNDPQNEDKSVKGEVKAPSAFSVNTTVSSSSTARQQESKRKRRFYEVIKKHFTSRQSE